MEIAPNQPETENPSPSSSTNSNGHAAAVSGAGAGATQTPPITPRPVSRSEPNPYPTTFVQADTTSFKQVVQMLTGSPKPTQDPNPNPNPNPTPAKISIPPVKTNPQKKQGFKLYERRNSLKNGLMINPSVPKFGHSHGLSPRIHEILSPSILDFPALVLSPVTPLIEDPFDRSSVGNSSSEEERVIAEKGFYLHPSPRTATAAEEPRLLPLFPVKSPEEEAV